MLTRDNLHTIFGLKAEVADPFNDGSVVVVPHPRIPANHAMAGQEGE